MLFIVGHYRYSKENISMIFSLLFNVIFIFITAFIAILPASSALPSVIADGFNYIFGFLWNFDNLVSVQVIFTLVGLYIFFEASILLFDMVVWVIHLVRGK